MGWLLSLGDRDPARTYGFCDVVLRNNLTWIAAAIASCCTPDVRYCKGPGSVSFESRQRIFAANMPPPTRENRRGSGGRHGEEEFVLYLQGVRFICQTTSKEAR